MSRILYGEGLYKDKYLKEADKNYIEGIRYAICSLNEDNLDMLLTGYKSIDGIVKEISTETIIAIRNQLEMTLEGMIVGIIDSYDEDYLNACWEVEDKEHDKL